MNLGSLSMAVEGSKMEMDFPAYKMLDEGTEVMEDSTEISSSGVEESSEEDSDESSKGDTATDDDEEDEDDDSDSEEESSSDDSSLGSTIMRMEAEAAASGRASPFQSINSMAAQLNTKRSNSMTNLMQLDLSDKSINSLKRGLAVDSQQQNSFQNFMNRMNNTTAPKIFQSPTSAKPTSNITSSVGQSKAEYSLPAQQGVAVFGGAAISSANQTGQGGRLPQKSRSANALTDMKKAETSSVDVDSPNTKFQNLVQEISSDFEGNKHWLSESFWQNYFLPITEERTNAYKMETVRAMRGQDLPTLRRIFYEQGGRATMEACNQQGESLLHLACRRRNADLVSFLVEEAKVRVKVRDDWGKTPLHELCWQSEPRTPAQFKSFQLLIHHAPELLVARDRRGFFPLQYIPKQAWRDWSRFLEKNKQELEWKIELIDFDRAKERLRATLKMVREGERKDAHVAE